MINFDDFKKLDIRLGTILSAEKVEGTDRLLKLLLDMGGETRQVISGIAVHYPDPSVLVGKQVPVLVNLEPRTIKGEVSNGMVLYAIDGEDKLTTLEPGEALGNGSVVR